MKKLIGIITAIGIICFGICASGQDFEMEAFCDSQEKKVTVEILCEDKDSAPIIVYFLDMEDDMFTPDMISEENIAEKVVGLTEAVLANGKYTAEIVLPDTLDSGWYLLVAEDIGAQDDIADIELSKRSAKLFYAGEDLTKEAIDAVNNAGESNIGDVLDKYKDVFSIDLSKEYNQTVAKALLSVKNYQYDGKFTKLSEINKEFLTARAIGQVISEKDNKSRMIEKYATALGIALTDDYFAYKQDVTELMDKNAPEITATSNAYSDVKKLFEESVALAALNNANREEITDVLKNYMDIFELSVTDEVYTENAIEVNKALRGMDFTSIQSVKDAYKERIEELLRPESGGTSGGGSGGGGFSSVGYTPSVSPEPEKKPEENEELKFNDLGNVLWAEEAIYDLAKRGIVSGYDDGTFKPNENIKREEFVKMLVAAFGLIDENAVYDFSDGDSKGWYAVYIASAKASGIVSGYEDGSFGIGRNLSREEMAAMAYRVSDISAAGGTEPFADDDIISDYSKPAVYAMRAAGIISGMDGSNFNPSEPATRAQAAQVLYKLIGGSADE